MGMNIVPCNARDTTSETLTTKVQIQIWDSNDVLFIVNKYAVLLLTNI